MSKPFKEIRITSLADHKTQRSQKASGLRLVHLTRSGEPPGEWVQLFEEARRFPRHSMWRGAWIEGSDIVIECVPEEIEQHHLKDLKEDVATANQQFVQRAARVDAQNAKRQEEERKERERLAGLKSKLKFN